MQATARNHAIKPLSGEFCSATEERCYRETQSARELFVIRFIWSVSLACFLLYAPLDHSLSRGAPALWSLPRTLILVCGLLMLLVIGSFRSAAARDGVTSLALFLVMACYGWLLGERTAADIAPGALLLLVVGAYSFCPGRFSLLGLAAWAGSLAAVTILWWRSAAFDVHWLDFSMLLPANLLAALALGQTNRARRCSYRQGLQLQQEVRRRRSAQRSLQRLHRRNLALLHNALPPAVAKQLSAHPGCKPARLHGLVAVLFADIVGFSELCRRLDASRVVAVLNSVFSCFDELTERHGLEKIKTVGDAYLAVAGVTQPAASPARGAGLLALALQQSVVELSRKLDLDLQLRVGVHSGPLVAGVIGDKRYAFDVWGETVNIASRLQGAAAPGRILVSAVTRQSCPADFLFGSDRKLPLKGCGEVLACNLYARQSVTELGGDQARRRFG